VKILSETAGLTRLTRLKDELRGRVASYERVAKRCSLCETPGACCLDEHFVNVRISRLEAVAIARVIERLPSIQRAGVEERITNAAAELLARDGHVETYACPLYEKGTGCLVHRDAKPVPCMVHACYERQQDLPPDELQDGAELAIDRLNERVYSRAKELEPLPIAVAKARSKTAVS